MRMELLSVSDGAVHPGAQAEVVHTASAGYVVGSVV